MTLDEFEDEELQGQTCSKTKYDGGIKEYIDLKNSIIDLGLPSGTQWCQYNVGVNLNQLNKAEDWYGNYYAWGEIKNKLNYSWQTYSQSDNKNNPVKYNISDNYTELLKDDDAATQNMNLPGFLFYTPTETQYKELMQYTVSEWYDNRNPYLGIKRLTGQLFKSKINGNEIFFPAAGYTITNFSNGITIFEHINDTIFLWTSQYYLNNCKYGMCYTSNKLNNKILTKERFIGIPVRGVINLNDII